MAKPARRYGSGAPAVLQSLLPTWIRTSSTRGDGFVIPGRASGPADQGLAAALHRKGVTGVCVEVLEREAAAASAGNLELPWIFSRPSPSKVVMITTFGIVPFDDQIRSSIVDRQDTRPIGRAQTRVGRLRFEWGRKKCCQETAGNYHS